MTAACTSRALGRLIFAAALGLGVLSCAESPNSPGILSEPRFAKPSGSTGPTVTSTNPSEAERGTTLDVQVIGTGFDNGSQAHFELHGVTDSRVRVNSTRYVKTTQLIANVSIASDAVADKYDAVVITTLGKKGIGTEKFVVAVQTQVLFDGTVARGVNQTGDIVGRANGGVNCSTTALPILWRADGTRVALPLGSRCGGLAWTINESGMILGWLFGGPVDESGIWRLAGSEYVLEPLPAAPDGKRPITNGGLNNAGEVVGWALSGGVYWWSEATGWIAMAMPPSATSCRVQSAHNNLGMIAGQCTVAGVKEAYFWLDRGSAPVLLPRPAATGEPTPMDMNDEGTIVGWLTGNPTRPIRWSPSGSSYTVEFLPDNGSGGAAYGISEDGTVTGAVKKSSYDRPVYWRSAGTFGLLGSFTGSGQTGTAWEASSTPSGFVAVGVKGGSAVRWIVP